MEDKDLYVSYSQRKVNGVVGHTQLIKLPEAKVFADYLRIIPPRQQ